MTTTTTNARESATVTISADELAELRRQADEKAMTEAEGLSKETENKKAALRAKAEARLEKAAALVVERIVNS